MLTARARGGCQLAHRERIRPSTPLCSIQALSGRRGAPHRECTPACNTHLFQRHLTDTPRMFHPYVASLSPAKLTQKIDHHKVLADSITKHRMPRGGQPPRWFQRPHVGPALSLLGVGDIETKIKDPVPAFKDPTVQWNTRFSLSLWEQSQPPRQASPGHRGSLPPA